MHIDTEALAALAGLEPMPRTPLTINPCPEGYQLKLVGGSLTCVLEGADEVDLQRARAIYGNRDALKATQSSRGPSAPIAINPVAFGGTGGGG